MASRGWRTCAPLRCLRARSAEILTVLFFSLSGYAHGYVCVRACMCVIVDMLVCMCVHMNSHRDTLPTPVPSCHSLFVELGSRFWPPACMRVCMCMCVSVCLYMCVFENKCKSRTSAVGPSVFVTDHLSLFSVFFPSF